MRKRTLSNKYTIIETIQEGCFSTVYLARHLALDSPRIIKSIKKNSDVGRRSLREAHILKSLNHPSIPSCYDIEEDDTNLYIIEEYIEGVSLNVYISTPNSFKTEDIYKIIYNICDVISYLHNLKPYIMHLDLKPENIIVHKDLSITLIDFGNAIYEGDEVDYSIGTPGFAPPEQFNHEMLDKRADIYSLGAVILYICTGRIGEDNKHLIKDYCLRNIVNTCLSYSPSERYSTVYDIIKELHKGHKKLSLKIGITGTKSGVGVTHICLVLGRIIASLGYSVLVREEEFNNSFSSLIESESLVIRDGIARFKNIDILPSYHECVTDIKPYDYDVTICDFATHNVEYDFDFKIIVGYISPHKLCDTINLLKKLSPDEDIIFLANLSEIGNLTLRKITGVTYSFSVPYANYMDLSKKVTKAYRPVVNRLLKNCQISPFKKIRNAFTRI